jgi:hypothetical protein
VSTADRDGPQSLHTMRGSSSVLVQVTTAPALIVKNMAKIKSRLRDGPVYSYCVLKCCNGAAVMGSWFPGYRRPTRLVPARNGTFA